MSRALAALLALAVLAVVAAGCGSSGSTGGSNSSGGGNNNNNGGAAVYTAKGTVACLRTRGFKGVTTARDKVGLIAAFAGNGGLKATAKSGNVLTIAFAQDSTGVHGTEKAFTRFAKGVYKRHIRDVMRSQGNAVLVWTETPKNAELSDALGCLHS